MQRATATAVAAPTTRSPARRPLLLPLPLSVGGRRKRIRESLRSPAARSPLREIESRLTAPRAANRPAWPRRTAAAASAEGEEARQRRPPNENQAKRRAKRARSGPVGSNRGLFCQCSLVHEAGKSWCQEKSEETETEERKSSSSGRGSGRGLRCGSDTAFETFPFLHGDFPFPPAKRRGQFLTCPKRGGSRGKGKTTLWRKMRDFHPFGFTS